MKKLSDRMELDSWNLGIWDEFRRAYLDIKTDAKIPDERVELIRLLFAEFIFFHKELMDSYKKVENPLAAIIDTAWAIADDLGKSYKKNPKLFYYASMPGKKGEAYSEKTRKIVKRNIDEVLGVAKKRSAALL